MRTRLTLAAAVLVLGSSALAQPTALASATQPRPPQPESGTASARTVAELPPGPWGAFAESMAADRDGGLVVSLTLWGVEGGTYGQLFRVTPDGVVTAFGPSVHLGDCALLTGVTVDRAGHVLAAVANVDPSCGEDSPASGVLRVTESSASRVLTMPTGTFANGVAVHRGRLYVTDSDSGAVWSGRVDEPSSPTEPWFSAPELTPTEQIPMGANGVTYHAGSLFVTGYARGYVLRVHLGPHGRSAATQVAAHDQQLVRADGISFDRSGRLWVAVNPEVNWDSQEQLGDGSLATISPHGRVALVATPDHALDYPTQPIPRDGGVYVVNGSYVNGTPWIVELTHLH